MSEEPGKPTAEGTGTPPEDIAGHPAARGGRLRKLLGAVRKAFQQPQAASHSASTSPRTSLPGQPLDLSSGSFDVHIVGEGRRQPQIRRVARAAERNKRGYLEFTAILRREPHNRYDPNAIAVYGPDGRTQLGYISAEDAEFWADAVSSIEAQGQVITCRAIIIGENKPNFGVVLDLDVERLECEWKV